MREEEETGAEGEMREEEETGAEVGKGLPGTLSSSILPISRGPFPFRSDAIPPPQPLTLFTAKAPGDASSSSSITASDTGTSSLRLFVSICVGRRVRV